MFALVLAQRKAITLLLSHLRRRRYQGHSILLIATRALIAMAASTILALTVQKFIVRGLTFGAVKG